MEISNKFDIIEHSYIHEKLGSWRADLASLSLYLQNYAETADPIWIGYFNEQLEFLRSPDSPLQRELSVIEGKRCLREAGLLN